MLLLFLLFAYGVFAAQIGPSSEYMGALSMTELGHGMILYVNYTQYPDRLSYSAWFYNPQNYAYWNDKDACLLFIVGTPPVAETKEKDCTFLVNQCLVSEGEELKIVDNCGNGDFVLEPQYIQLSNTKYCGLHQLYAASYTDVSIDPNSGHNIAFQSVYSKQGQARPQCTNFQLGNGTLFDFQYYDRDNSGHYLTNDFSHHHHSYIALFMTFVISLYMTINLI